MNLVLRIALLVVMCACIWLAIEKLDSVLEIIAAVVGAIAAYALRRRYLKRRDDEAEAF